MRFATWCCACALLSACSDGINYHPVFDFSAPPPDLSAASHDIAIATDEDLFGQQDMAMPDLTEEQDQSTD